VTVPVLDDAGGGTVVTFPARSTTAVRITITTVSASTQNIGLSEVQVYAA
jgi:hypothetical protein